MDIRFVLYSLKTGFLGQMAAEVAEVAEVG